MKITPAEYSRPVAEKVIDPEVVKLVSPFAQKGIDTAFAVETTKADAAADKAKIQAAVNWLGYTARQIDVLPEDEFKALDDSAEVTLTFVIRPKRKPRGEGKAVEVEVDTE